VSELLARPPYGPRDDARLVAELDALTAHHRAGCPAYARIAPPRAPASATSDLPFVHVGVFKHLDLRTTAAGIEHQRVLTSSATTSGVSSRIALDARSSKLQSDSTLAIFRDWLGSDLCPLIVLDSAKSLLKRGELSARVAAAMSLRPLASAIGFVLGDPADPRSVDWAELARQARAHPRLVVYGFTWILWQAWGTGTIPDDARAALAGTRVDFVHSGGWKKLEAAAVDRARFDAALTATTAPGSRIIDYYGLVEQVGIIYPLCEHGVRHVPVWADVVVRDPYTLDPLADAVGQLQLLNITAWGAPYHSVLTEDLGRILPGACPCGRSGPRFELAGRVPRAEVRGCANV
jgi:hypothetical protein